MSAENQEPTDQDLLNDVLSDETTDGPVVTEQTEQVEAHPETEATEAATTETTAERPAVDDNAPQVPSWRVREINEEKRRFAEENERMKAELAELRRAQQQPRPQAQPEQQQRPARPDPLLDPDGYAKAIRDELREEALNERREESLQAAAEQHPEDFKAAYALAQQRVDPALKARMQESRNPGKTLLSWYREQKTMQEVGNDPNAWLEKKLEERLKDPAFLAKAAELARGSAQQNTQTNGRPRTDLPPSLNGASRANTTLKSNVEDVSDAELFQQVAG